MTAHTPGPWDALTSDVFAKAMATLIATAGHPELAGYDTAELPPNVQAEIAANLRLIKAAPDVLEALVDASTTLEMLGKQICLDGMTKPALTSPLGMAKAAIAKATAP